MHDFVSGYVFVYVGGYSELSHVIWMLRSLKSWYRKLGTTKADGRSHLAH